MPDPSLLHELLYAALDDFQPLAIQEQPDGDGWLVFFRTPTARDGAAAALADFAGEGLESVAPLSVPDEDWARRSQATLTAITVGRITVAPPWDEAVRQIAPARRASESAIRSPESLSGSAPRTVFVGDTRTPIGDPASPSDRGTMIPDSATIVIVIEPSMGFGTGHHQTTRLCLALLQSIDVTGRRVIDVGTGSGVLAIAAWRLGAGEVIAMDNDPDAIHNARENVERNRASAIAVRCEELAAFAADPADIVTANLTAAVLRRHASSIVHLVAPAGTLIVSGFSPDELPTVVADLTTGRATEVRHAAEGEWAAALIKG